MKVLVTRRDPGSSTVTETYLEHEKAQRVEVGGDGGLYLYDSNSPSNRTDRQLAGVRDFHSFKVLDD